MKNPQSWIGTGLAVLCLLLSPIRMEADPPPFNELPGNSKSVEAEASNAELVIVGVLEKLGRALSTPIGQSTHHESKVKVTSVLKGVAGKEIETSVIVMHEVGKKVEIKPKEGVSYIFFIKPDRFERNRTTKIAPADEASVEAVRNALIGAKR